jgi:hypothetical protein
VTNNATTKPTNAIHKEMRRSVKERVTVLKNNHKGANFVIGDGVVVGMRCT